MSITYLNITYKIGDILIHKDGSCIANITGFYINTEKNNIKFYDSCGNMKDIYNYKLLCNMYNIGTYMRLYMQLIKTKVKLIILTKLNKQINMEQVIILKSEYEALKNIQRAYNEIGKKVMAIYSDYDEDGNEIEPEEDGDLATIGEYVCHHFGML